MGKLKENKRYFWIQLTQDFFKSKEMKLLRKMPGGDTYTIIYQKMLLVSLEDGGKIYYDDLADDLAEEVSLLIDEDIEAVRMTLLFLENKGLLKRNSEKEYFLEQVPEMVGSETASTRRSRKHREQKALQCNTNATLGNGDIDIEKEREKEREKEKDKEKEYNVEQSPTEYLFPDWLSEKYVEQVKKGNPKNYDFRIPIAYLNQETNATFKFVDSNINLVKSRLRNGYNLADFKRVIDVKVADWKNDSNWNKYLRPSTLFNATKFESYLNQPIKSSSYDANDALFEEYGIK